MAAVRRSGALALLLASVLGVVAGSPVADAGTGPSAPTRRTASSVAPVRRIGGSTRFATAVGLSVDTFPVGAGVAYLLSADDLADGPAAAAAAAGDGGPLLYVTRDRVPAETADELIRLNPARMVVVGGPHAVSDAVVDELRDLLGVDVFRVAGASKAGTAAALSASLFRPGVPVVNVVNSNDLADALPAGAAAGAGRVPILGVDTDHIPNATVTELRRLRPGWIHIVGGTATVSAAVEAALHQFTKGSVGRSAGADRYATAAAVAVNSFKAPVPTAVVTGGEDYADGITAAVVAGRRRGPLLYMPGGCLTDLARVELARLTPQATIVAGSRGPSSTLLDQPALCTRPSPPPPPATGLLARFVSQLPGTADGDATPAVALTFDDGPSAYTGAVLDILDAKRVPATFFVIGRYAAAAPELVAREAREGHDVGGHTWNHHRLVGLDDPTFAGEVDRTDDVVASITGRPVACVRPPYGTVDLGVVGRLGARHVSTILWSVDPQDWRRPGAEQIVARVLATVRPGSIILLHDGGGDRSETVAALPAIIDGIRARGWRFVPVC